MTGNTKTKTKVYSAMVEDLTGAIRHGRWVPDQCLPSENDLCRQYGISRVSVRQALKVLGARGLIYRRAGKGTYVASAAGCLPPFDRRIIGLSCNFAGIKPSASTGFFTGPVFEGVRRECESRKMRMEFVGENSLGERAGDLLGYIGISSGRSHIDYLRKLKLEMPVVLINRLPEEHTFHAVTIDHEKWARLGMEFLLGLGHRQIGTVAINRWPGFIRQRLAGVKAATRSFELPLPRHDVFLDENADGNDRLRILLDQRRVTALFLLQGNVVFPVLAMMRELGLRVPEDVSVLVFDDVANTFSPWIPELTAVRQPLELLGQRAVDMIYRIRTEGITERQVEIIPAELVVRESCRVLRD